jgi:hypothetical protein
MKRALLLMVLVLIPVLVSAQTFIDENFSGDFPPTGWAADSHAANWLVGASNIAGGDAPEAVFSWGPQFSGTARFMSPRINTTGLSQLFVEFTHSIDHYQGAYTVGVATRAGTGTWNTVWQKVNPSGSIGPEAVSVEIDNADVGADDFQICWFFSGSSYNINFWYFDDIIVYSPMAHDIKAKKILTDDQYEAGSVIRPTARIQNFGLNEETFSASFQIMLGEESVYNETLNDINLAVGETEDVRFPNFTIPTENVLYDVTVTTYLDGDQEPSNDTKTKIFNTYTTMRDMVLLEIGTGTWCQYCPGAAMGAEDLIDNGFNVAVVEYHQGNTDPYQNQPGLDRLIYYGINNFPTAVFDGVQSVSGGSNNQSMFSNYVPIVTASQPINSAFTIEMRGENYGNNYNLLVSVNKMAPFRYDDMTLHVVLTQSHIQYNWQGQTHLEWVERLMIPSSSGSQVNLSGSDTQDFNLSFSKDASWPVQDCELVAFIQNGDNREILQATKVLLTDLTPIGVDDNEATLPTQTMLEANYPNPFNPRTSINFSLATPGTVKLEVFNILGQKIRTLVDGHMEPGIHTISWDSKDESGASVASGAYFYKLTTDDYSSTKKMLLLK